MPQKYKYQLTNGKTLTLEGDTMPSDDEVEGIAKEQGVQLALNDSPPPQAATNPQPQASPVQQAQPAFTGSPMSRFNPNPVYDTEDGLPPKPKEPDTWWGGFGKGLNEYGEELGRGMFESAAHPKTLGDILGLLLPAELPRMKGVSQIAGDMNEIPISRTTQAIKTASGETRVSGRIPQGWDINEMRGASMEGAPAKRGIETLAEPLDPRITSDVTAELPVSDPKIKRKGIEEIRYDLAREKVNMGRDNPELVAKEQLNPFAQKIADDASKPTAEFIGMQPTADGGEIPLFNVKGGPKSGSTVTMDALHEMGIKPPEVPVNQPRMSGDQARAAAIAKRSKEMDAKAPGFKGVVDEPMSDFDRGRKFIKEDTERMQRERLEREADPVWQASEQAKNDDWNTTQRNMSEYEGNFNKPNTMEYTLNDSTNYTPEQLAVKESYQKMKAFQDESAIEFSRREAELPEDQYYQWPPEEKAAYESKLEEMKGAHEDLLEKLTNRPTSNTIDVKPVKSTFKPLEINEGESIIDYMKRNGVEGIDTTPEQALANRKKLAEPDRPGFMEDERGMAGKNISSKMNTSGTGPDKPFGRYDQESGTLIPTDRLTGEQTGPAYMHGKELVPELAQISKYARQAKLANETQKGSMWSQIRDTNRALLTAFDLSAPGRQGKALLGTKAYWTSFDDMFKSWGSQRAYDNVMESIEMMPEFKQPKLPDGSYGKSLAERGGLNIGGKEEMFRSNLAEKIPGVKASERAYSAFLSKLRADHFRTMVNDARKMGMKPDTNDVVLRQLATFINDATGRGSLGKLERIAPQLSEVFFAPKLMASRVNMYKRWLDPRTYGNANPIVRQQAIKSLLSTVGFGLAVGELGRLAGGQVSNDPTSTDFRKVKIGNSRIDPFSGFQQYAVGATRFLSGHSTSSKVDPWTKKPNEYDLTSGKFGMPTRASVTSQFFQNKLAPIPSLVWSWMEGRDWDGQPFELKKAILDRTVPIVMQDLMEIWKEDPTSFPEGVFKENPNATKFGMSLLPIAGEGLQTYGR